MGKRGREGGRERERERKGEREQESINYHLLVAVCHNKDVTCLSMLATHGCVLIPYD